MALINPCNLSIATVNTGSDCDAAMKATAMVIMVPKNAVWTDADLLDFMGFLKTKFHAAPASRFLPIFGSSAPIRSMNESNESDIIETMEDGSQQFIRYGMFNRTFMTDKGGLCLAKSLMQLGNNYAFIDVDITGQVAKMKNADGTYSGFPLNLAYAPIPTLANLKTSYKNNFLMSFSPLNYIKKGKIFASSGEDILSLRGLFDVVVYSAAPSTNSGATKAIATDTITAIGADNDTINVTVNGVSISGGTVVKTAAESTVTLLANKIVAAINANTATNGGYTATNAVGAITISGPFGLGNTLNAILPVNTIVGTIAATPAAFAGGVTGSAVLKVGVKTDCAETDLVGLYGALLVTAANFLITKGGVAVVATVALVSGQAHLTIPYINGTYKVALAAPSVLKAASIEGYDGSNFPATIVLT
jgi:hypothetical protein